MFWVSLVIFLSATMSTAVSQEALQLWERYQLGLKRNMSFVVGKYRNRLLDEYPKSSYAIRLQVEELKAALFKNGITVDNTLSIKSLQASHPHNKNVLALVDLVWPMLLSQVERDVATGKLKLAQWIVAIPLIHKLLD